MSNIYKSNGISIEGKIIYINGERLPDCPADGVNVVVINDKIFIDGYEYKKGEWRKTIRAWFHKHF